MTSIEQIEGVGVVESGVFSKQEKLQLELLKITYIDEIEHLHETKLIPFLITKLFKHVFT